MTWTLEVLPSPKPLSTVGHLAMGMALGVVFALALLFIANHSVLMLISNSPSPALGLTLFIGVLALTFGLGATLTGLVLEDADEQ